jgi:adenosylhomocysteine nucleosidase
MKVLVIVSANAEWGVVKEIHPELALQQSPFGEFADLKICDQAITLFHGGWGKISAAASAQYAIDRFKPGLIVNLGTCGGFAGRIESGTIILVEWTLVYDIIEQMGDSSEAILHYASPLDLSWLSEPYPYPVWRGLLVSADRDIVMDEIPELTEKYDAVAADWESGAIAWVAQRNDIPILILRTVSDLVGGDGGEAYGNLELFHERTRTIMKQLLDQLPDWLSSIKFK